jgi:hypothetical protein
MVIFATGVEGMESLRGKMFETLMHIRLAECGHAVEILCFPGRTQAQLDMKPHIAVINYIFLKIYLFFQPPFKDLAIVNFAYDTYYQPYSRIFETVDSFYISSSDKTCYLFQVTVSPTHSYHWNGIHVKPSDFTLLY